MRGLITCSKRIKHNIDLVSAAAAIAFGFVNIHPFSDDNGRIHRYLIHHVLAENGYNPKVMIFPISSSMLLLLDEYEHVLKGYSHGILPFIKWEPTIDHNVRILNSTIDYYRYFDATPYPQFLYNCVEKTIKHDLIEEAQFLVVYDQFRITVQEKIEIPNKIVYILYNFLSQNGGGNYQSEQK